MKHLISALALLALPLALCAQPGEGDPRREERIERLKRAYLSEKLDLTVEEAEKFWPLYNEYGKQRKSNRRAIREAHQRMSRPGVTEKEVLAASREITEARHREADADHAFMESVLPVLGPEKAGRLLQLEEEFRRELMRRLQERREQREGGGGGPGYNRPRP